MQMLQPAVEEHGAQFVADQADQNERVSASYLTPLDLKMLPLLYTPNKEVLRVQ